MSADDNEATHGFGSRLRRLLDRLDRDILALYREAGVSFEPRCYALFNAICDGGPATMAELTERLGLSPTAISQARSTLQAEGLTATRAAADGRQMLILTPKGAATRVQLQPLWAAINDATAAVLGEASPGLIDGLEALSRALDERPLKARVEERL